LTGGKGDFPKATDAFLTQSVPGDMRGLELMLVDNCEGPGIQRIMAVIIAVIEIVVDDNPRVVVVA